MVGRKPPGERKKITDGSTIGLDSGSNRGHLSGDIDNALGSRLSRFARIAKVSLRRFTRSIARSPRRYLALTAIAVLPVALVAMLIMGFDAQTALDLVRRHHGWLRGFVAGAPALASMLFMVIYAAAVAVSVPGVAVLTVIGGYLFGWFQGTALALVAATVGASAVFLLTRSALGDGLRARARPARHRFTEGFRRNALSYGFALNLVPIFPYALIIAIPAVCGVGLPTFIAGMVLGLIPGTFLFAHLGSGLHQVLMSGVPLRLASFLTPDIVLSLCGLTVLALLPVAYRALRAPARRLVVSKHSATTGHAPGIGAFFKQRNH